MTKQLTNAAKRKDGVENLSFEDWSDGKKLIKT